MIWAINQDGTFMGQVPKDCRTLKQLINLGGKQIICDLPAGHAVPHQHKYSVWDKNEKKWKYRAYFLDGQKCWESYLKMENKSGEKPK